MMNELTITIPGKPIAKARPRFSRRGKFVITYSAQQTEEGRWLWDVTQSLGPDFGIISAPIELSFTFNMPIPSSISKTKRKSLKFHIKKPDIDNMLKFCLDCLNGVLFVDDRQVCRIEAVKVYSETPGTVIHARWENGNLP